MKTAKNLSIEYLIKKLTTLYACAESVKWLATQKNLKQAYENCEYADWLLWLAAKVGIDRKVIVSAACDCAAKVLKHVPKGEERPRKAIQTARAWVRGKATISEVKTAANAANVAADAAYTTYADTAYADTAVYAAYAYAADYTAAYAADYTAAYAAATNAARSSTQKAMCKAVRKRIPFKEFKRAIKDM